MKKQLLLIVSIVLALGLSSCSKKMGELSPDLFKVNPNPLEVKGGKIEAKIDGKFPEKYFQKKAVVTVTPILRYEGGEVKGTSKTFQGESVNGNNQVINKATGGSFSLTPSFNYTPEMAKCQLYLDFDIKIGSKDAPKFPAVKVADGAITTSQLAADNAGGIAPAITPDKFQQIIRETQEADIKFLIQQANLRTSETGSQGIKNLNAAIKDANATANKDVAELSIKGYASPDGPYALNRNLAEQRLKVTRNFMNSELKKSKSTAPITTDFTPEDWEGFKKLMESSNVQDKELILRVLSMYSDPEQREREIKNISSAYKVIADDILPQLRRSRLELIVQITGKSDAEITRLAASNPESLTAEELLYAATLTDNLNEKAAIYEKAIRLFNSDVRGYNNLGMVRFQQGNLDEATRLFTKAGELAPTDANVNYNLGLLALAKGETAKAEQYLGKAAGTNANLEEALGTMYILKGDYTNAKSAFGSEANNNSALSQILSGDYNMARRTLSSVGTPDAMTYYLGAIVGARTNDRNSVYENLKQSIKMDRTYARKALTDLEFSKFVADQAFLSIVK